jgi:hypothetical protein
MSRHCYSHHAEAQDYRTLEVVEKKFVSGLMQSVGTRDLDKKCFMEERCKKRQGQMYVARSSELLVGQV